MKDGYTWTVQITIAPNWVADGFDLTDDRMHGIMARHLAYAYGHEIECKVIDRPSDERVAAEQGFKLSDYLHRRKAER